MITKRCIRAFDSVLSRRTQHGEKMGLFRTYGSRRAWHQRRNACGGSRVRYPWLQILVERDSIVSIESCWRERDRERKARNLGGDLRGNRDKHNLNRLLEVVECFNVLHT